MNNGAQPDIGQLDNPNEGVIRTSMLCSANNANDPIRSRDRNQTIFEPPRSSPDTSKRGDKTECAQEETPRVLHVWWQRSSWLCPTEDDCQDVD